MQRDAFTSWQILRLDPLNAHSHHSQRGMEFLNFRQPLVEAMIADGHRVKTNAPDPAGALSPQLESAQ